MCFVVNGVCVVAWRVACGVMWYVRASGAYHFAYFVQDFLLLILSIPTPTRHRADQKMKKKRINW